MATQIIEQCHIAPSHGAPATLSLKLLHFDLMFIPFGPIRLVTFYKFPCSESHFLNTIVPSLKNSLAISLKHFPPLAGKILIPHENSVPISHFAAGKDSVHLSIAISGADFENLTPNHSVETHRIHYLFPHLFLDSSPNSSTVKLPVTSFHVTLFPGKGVCIGLTGHHSVCDAVTLISFFRAWGSINRFNGESSSDLSECLPIFDRNTVVDGDRFAVKFWDAIKPYQSGTTNLPDTSSVRATFVLGEAGIRTLERCAFPDGVRGSSFAVACAHLWTCLARSANAAGEDVGDEEPEYISCPVDCRRLLNPPLPDTYFGNCMTAAVAELSHGKLKGRDGFSAAVGVIREAIRRTVNHEEGIMDATLKASLRALGLSKKRILLVSGSPRLDFYGADYGWERPVKVECFMNYKSRVVFINKSREFQGAMEITMLMDKKKMEAFAGFFTQGLPTEAKPHCKM